MEEEIDSLFLGQDDSEIKESSIKDLEICSDKIASLVPFIDIICGKMGSIKMDYDLYYIKLERLAKEMATIEDANTKLENEILYQTSIYNRLRDLLISLEIKEEHFISLETEALDTPEGLSKIEKALNILCSFDIPDYTIRVVEEKKERIEKALRSFYKRFIHFLGTFFGKKEASSGVLRVHSDLYSRMKAYKDIYAYSRRFPDFYAVLCRVYFKHAQNLYSREIETHLATVHKLLTNEDKDKVDEKVEECLGGLMETYKSIEDCESKFLKDMNIDLDSSEVFSSSNKIILDFIEDVFYISPLSTIIFLEHNEHEELKIKLKKKFISREMEVKDPKEGLKRFKEIIKKSKIDDLNSVLYGLNKERILRRNKDTFELLESKMLLDDLIYADMNENLRNEHFQCINDLHESIKKSLIGYVFEEGDAEVEGRLKEIGRKVKGGKLQKEVYEILSETVDDKEALKKIILDN
ncbi:hypothetical protein NGRA_1285 [Nosema granulosis]|uniref:Exocyst complex component Sec3 coiled-coil domain-containing protein n=1 Tax=Nosema granulosis TaxID=83296 RepID=A0A9P6GYQ5_9MICR|nr:hypothetical protein NGRA_1285 [Nosema granulosis]